MNHETHTKIRDRGCCNEGCRRDLLVLTRHFLTNVSSSASCVRCVCEQSFDDRQHEAATKADERAYHHTGQRGPASLGCTPVRVGGAATDSCHPSLRQAIGGGDEQCCTIVPLKNLTKGELLSSKAIHKVSAAMRPKLDHRRLTRSKAC